MIRNWQAADGQHTGEHKSFAKNVKKWIAQGHTRPELCFLWAEDGVIKGGIAYAAGQPEPAAILDFSLGLDSFHLGAHLLAESQSKLSARSVCYHLYNDSEQYNDYKNCFLEAGFSVAQEKLSYRYTKSPPESEAANVEFRSFADVDEQEFINAVCAVTEQTLDRSDAESVTKHGQAKAAEILINDLTEIDFQPDIWLLAYVDAKLIGLVIPSDFGGGYGAINYIGVVPEERGKGYVDALLTKGTQLILSREVATVIADIDVLNIPMKHALERVGYDFFHDEVVLEKSL